MFKQKLAKMTTTPLLYHEGQVGNQCAVHAANNLLGRAAFTGADFRAKQIALAIPDEAPQGRCQRCCTAWLRRAPACCCRRCRTTGGNYDANVMSCILDEAGVELQWVRPGSDPDALVARLRDEPHCLGLLLNTQASSHNCLVAAVINCVACCFGTNGHWVAVRRRGVQRHDDSSPFFANMDSKLSTPKEYETEAEARSFVDWHVKHGTHILLAVTKGSAGNKKTT